METLNEALHSDSPVGKQIDPVELLERRMSRLAFAQSHRDNEHSSLWHFLESLEGAPNLALYEATLVDRPR